MTASLSKANNGVEVDMPLNVQLGSFCWHAMGACAARTVNARATHGCCWYLSVVHGGSKGGGFLVNACGVRILAQ